MLSNLLHRIYLGSLSLLPYSSPFALSDTCEISDIDPFQTWFLHSAPHAGKQEERDSDSDSESGDEAGKEEEGDDGAGPCLPGLQASRTTKGQQRRAEAAAKSAQADKLYGEEGQFNPQAARASRKKVKKQKKVSLGDDYDFAEAFADDVGLGDDADDAGLGEDAIDSDGDAGMS